MRMNFAILLAGLSAFSAVQANPYGNRLSLDRRADAHSMPGGILAVDSEVEKRLTATRGHKSGGGHRQTPPRKRSLFEIDHPESSANKRQVDGKTVFAAIKGRHGKRGLPNADSSSSLANQRIRMGSGGGSKGPRPDPPAKRDFEDDSSFATEVAVEKRLQFGRNPLGNRPAPGCKRDVTEVDELGKRVKVLVCSPPSWSGPKEKGRRR